jgi:hypothetical protein
MTARPMMQGVRNPELMFRSAALPEPMRARLLDFGYASQATELLMNGLPIVCAEQGQLVIEHLPGHRISVPRHSDYDQHRQFQRYPHTVMQVLPPATR